MKSIAITLGVVAAALAGHAAAQALLPGERDATITAIPGVVAAGAKWELIWADFNTADGILGTPDGGLLFAQEQTDTIKKIDANGKQSTYIAATRGAGSISLDTQGKLWAVERTCTEPLNTFLPGCNELTMITIVAPEHKVMANSFPNGSPLGRLNDLVADGKGGAYVTVGGVLYVNAKGEISTVAEQGTIRPNGIMLSGDGKTLYVTNDTSVVAFDVKADGTTTNRRDFALLNGDEGGDGMAIDSDGRLYVTAALGVHVLSAKGQHLGLIATPRCPITLAFSGPDKKWLFVPQMGAVGPDGKAWATPDGIRNTAMTIYKIPMLAQGFKGRAK